MDDTSKEICRICLTINTNMFDLFMAAEPKEVSLIHMLTSCASVQVNSEDCLPNLICAPCIKTLTVSYNFKKQCERSDKLLRSNIHISLPDCDTEKENITLEFEDIAGEEIKISGESSETEWIDDVNNIALKNRKNEEVFSCQLCDKSFIKQGNLKLHLTTHTAKNECKHCGLKCESYKDLIYHNRQQHRLFKCQSCEKSFSTGNALNGHMRYHKKLPKQIKIVDDAEYICVIGEGEQTEEIECLTVESDFKDPNNTRVIAQMIEGECFTCEICDYRFVNIEELNTHLKIHESNHECTTCNLKFAKYDSLISHNKNIHGIFNCKICTKSFPTSYGLSGHMRHHVTVSKGSPSIFYKCTINNCTRKFSTLDYLRRHKPSHFSKKKVYLCNLCGKTYNSNNSFYYHQKVHRNERPYMCSQCGNAYKLMCHLKSHMWKHTGIRPFECKRCGKRFTRSRVLKKHIERNCGSTKKKKLLLPVEVKPEKDDNEGTLSEIHDDSATNEVCEDVIISDEICVEDIEYYKT